MGGARQEVHGEREELRLYPEVDRTLLKGPIDNYHDWIYLLERSWMLGGE